MYSILLLTLALVGCGNDRPTCVRLSTMAYLGEEPCDVDVCPVVTEHGIEWQFQPRDDGCVRRTQKANVKREHPKSWRARETSVVGLYRVGHGTADLRKCTCGVGGISGTCVYPLDCRVP